MKDKKILILGRSSMLGCALFSKLYKDNQVLGPDKNLIDLMEPGHVDCCFGTGYFDIVFYLAGYNGGIAFNNKEPVEIYRRTCQMALNVLTAAQKYKAGKVIIPLTSCAYPDRLSNESALTEVDFWSGLPNSSVECHGLAKRAVMDYARQINKGGNTKAIGVILNNCYGPGDRFDPDRSKFGAALIRKFVEAKANNSRVILWGTGQAHRELLYCEDAADGMILTAELYDDLKIPLNIGVGQDYSIEEVANTIARKVGYNDEIIWDVSKPDGQMKKLLDNSRMLQVLNGWKPPTSLEDGLDKTIKWYQENRLTWKK